MATRFQKDNLTKSFFSDETFFVLQQIGHRFFFCFWSCFGCWCFLSFLEAPNTKNCFVLVDCFFPFRSHSTNFNRWRCSWPGGETPRPRRSRRGRTRSGGTSETSTGRGWGPRSDRATKTTGCASGHGWTRIHSIGRVLSRTPGDVSVSSVALAPSAAVRTTRRGRTSETGRVSISATSSSPNRTSGRGRNCARGRARKTRPGRTWAPRRLLALGSSDVSPKLSPKPKMGFRHTWSWSASPNVDIVEVERVRILELPVIARTFRHSLRWRSASCPAMAKLSWMK